MKITSSDILLKGNQPGKSIGNGSQSILGREIDFSFSKNRDSLKHRFFSETAMLIGSGLDLKNTLDIVISGIPKVKDKEPIIKILRCIEEGSSFSGALKNSGIFEKYDYFSVKIGEEGGSLTSVLEELASYYEKKISQQRQIRSALIYPSLVLITTVFSLTFMLNYIVPMFKDVFMRFKGNLPPITQFVVNLSNNFSNYLIVFLVFIISLLMFISICKKKEWFRNFSTRLILKIPVAGSVVSLTYKARFCQTMRLLLSSHVHLLEAVGLIEQMIDFFPMESALKAIKESISKGSLFSESMEPYPVFDKKLITLTRVAEEVNKLDVIYDQLYKQYSEELDVKIKTMNSLLEPVLIIFVGSIVAFILISMYMPIFQIGTSIA
jgi:type IV pilus assembly protein PilC